MMMRHGAVRAEIMALPSEDRLPWAVELLEELLGDTSPEVPALIRAGLSPTEARLVNVLSAASPRWVSKSVLRDIINPDLPPETTVLSTMVHYIRKRGVPVEGITGFYRLAEPVKVDLPPPVALSREGRKEGPRPDALPRRAGAEWSKAEDADLRAMVASGWCVAAMADELARTERGVAERLKVLGVRA
ncbi:MAG: hypothetical protein U1E58_10230 [Tabrizicola sp.]